LVLYARIGFNPGGGGDFCKATVHIFYVGAYIGTYIFLWFRIWWRNPKPACVTTFVQHDILLPKSTQHKFRYDYINYYSYTYICTRILCHAFSYTSTSLRSVSDVGSASLRQFFFKWVHQQAQKICRPRRTRYACWP